MVRLVSKRRATASWVVGSRLLRQVATVAIFHNYAEVLFGSEVLVILDDARGIQMREDVNFDPGLLLVLEANQRGLSQAMSLQHAPWAAFETDPLV